MRLFRLFLTVLAVAGPWRLSAADVDPLGIPLPPADVRGIRELQSRNLGAPSLDSAAPRQEGLLAIAELGGAAGRGDWNATDQAALFALLQNYRDELLGLGMDAAELEAQLAQLSARTTEVEKRLEKLKPKDGLKIHARVISAMDDLHVFGNGTLPSVAGFDGRPLKPAKASYLGLRTQMGVVGGTLDLQGTRGPASGRAVLGIISPWGTSYANVGLRRAYVELRLPVAIQFGDVDHALTQLTLWRNDTVDPFTPEPFASRELRLRKDLMLEDTKWRFRGARASTDLKLFDTLTLNLDSLSSIMANNTNNSAVSSANTFYQLPAPTVQGYLARYNIYLQAWQAKLGFGEGRNLAYQGTLFWDDTSTLTAASTWSFRAMNEMVHSVSGRWQAGGFYIEAEGGLSSFSAHALTYTAAPSPMTGTAYAAAIGWKGKDGKLRAFAQSATAGYHAAGAQGRTVDAKFQFLGPFMTENSQLDGSGKVGFVSPMVSSNASRLNDVLLPPGMAVGGAAAALSTLGSQWTHLLDYFAHEEIAPYGAASPNRAVFGGEAEWSLFTGLLKPIVGYETGGMVESTADSVGTTYAAFTMSRLRAGLEVDLKPATGWPLSFGVGYTSTTSANGGQSAAGKAYSLSSALMDAGVVLGKGGPFGLATGFRMLSYEGLHPVLFSSPSDKRVWDMLGIGGWWRPLEGTSVDLVYSSGHIDVPDYPLLGLQTEQVVLRLTAEF